MMAAEIGPNSHKSQQTEEKREPIVTGRVKEKKNPMRRAEEALVSEDAGSVKDYLVWDVLIPALKDTIVDMIKKGADAIFYGDRRTHSNNIERRNGTTYVRYDKPSYDTRDRRYAQPSRPHYSSRFNFGDIVFESKNDAEAILDELVESTVRYGMVAVSDFYELAGLDYTYTDYRYGWADLQRARVEKVRDGYVLYLPRPILLDEE